MSAIYKALRQARKDSGKDAGDPLCKNQQPDPLNLSTRALGSFSPQMTSLYGAIRSILDGKSGGVVIHIVAATRGEGSSTVAREFAFLAATAGHRETLLVDGDARNLETASQFRCPTDRGLVDYVRDNVSYDDALRSVPGAMLMVGSLVGVSPEAHPDSKTMRAAYALFRQRFDLTVVDCPAITAGYYAQLVPEAADGIIMVVQAERVRPAVAQYAKGLVEQAGGNFLGAVLNKRHNYIPEFLYRHL